MAKSDVLQVRLSPFDLECLQRASADAQMPLSSFVRRELEPAIVAVKIAIVARDFDYITRATLFGSMALGDHGADSDIDVAIETDKPYKWMGDKGMGRFIARIKEATGRDVDVVKAKYLKPEVAAVIEREGKVVYER